MFGLKTKRKIVVIESDDWGSLRMPNKNVYNSVIGKGIHLDRCPYSKYDTLETEEDLVALYEVFNRINKKFNKTPIITTNFLAANPDFEKIKENKFLSYEYENIAITYNKNKNSQSIKYILREGFNNQYIRPQFHGREHLNVKMWMKLLNENKAVKTAFDYNIFALSFNNTDTIKMPYLASFMKLEYNDDFSDIISSGIKEFKEFFGFYPQSFIAPVYVWDQNVEKVISEYEFNSIQGLFYRKNFNNYLDPKPKKIRRNFKKNSDFGQIQLVRNCFFEPSTSSHLDWVDECLKDVEVAFNWNRPAIICSHRLNFVGGMDEMNRNKNLKEFEKLISNIIKKWPDVVFVSSDEIENYL